VTALSTKVLMAAYATKYAVYFPKMYSWLSKLDKVELTRDISKAVMFDEMPEVEAALTALDLKEALIQKYKATLVISDNSYWHAPHA
jgi:hypothetical protein